MYVKYRRKGNSYFQCFLMLLGVSFIGTVVLYIENFMPFTFLSTYFHLANSTKSNIFHTGFDVNGSDALVFLHIQKTGGTLLERALVKDGLTSFQCHCLKNEKRCNCLNRIGVNWLFSRYSTGWKCGLHADWTELHICVPLFLKSEAENVGRKDVLRRPYYFTILRAPIDRYLSEWKHVQRGATWWRSRHICNGKEPTELELPSCYNDDDWTDVPINEFLQCASNLANNRQTRMLADLSLVGCYNNSWPKRDEILLKSAQMNLKSLSFFGILEHITMTQYLFQRTFNLTFHELLLPHNVTHSKLIDLPNRTLQKIRRVNELDLKLYLFAERLFLERVLVHLNRDRSKITMSTTSNKKDNYYQQIYLDWNRIAALDTTYARQNVDRISSNLINLLLLEGSSFPANEKLLRQRTKWKDKLMLEMEMEYRQFVKHS